MILTEADIRAVVLHVVSPHVAEELEAGQSFDDAGIDSLDKAAILLRLDEVHGIRIPDSAFELVNSIRAVLDFVNG